MNETTITRSLTNLYKIKFADTPTHISCLKGDGSDRKVFRLTSEKRPSIIGVFGPNKTENDAFVSFSRAFAAIHLPVPHIAIYDAQHQVYLEDDLGNVTLFDWMTNSNSSLLSSTAILELYQQVILWLVQFQFNGHKVVDYSKCYQYESFQKDAIYYDLNYFKNSFLNRFHKTSMRRVGLAHDFETIVNQLAPVKSDYFLYRDFQCRNIMLFDSRLYFIDYQSGRKGALQYDIASLLFDANICLPQAMRDELLDFYVDVVATFEKIDTSLFKSFYYDFVLIRMLQALAAFAHLAFDKGKKYFLKNIPFALANIHFLFDRDCILQKLPELSRVFNEDLLVNFSMERRESR